MTHPIDILGNRPPIMRAPIQDSGPDYQRDDDGWKGEQHIRITPVPHGGGSYPVRKKSKAGG